MMDSLIDRLVLAFLWLFPPARWFWHWLDLAENRLDPSLLAAYVLVFSVLAGYRSLLDRRERGARRRRR